MELETVLPSHLLLEKNKYFLQTSAPKLGMHLIGSLCVQVTRFQPLDSTTLHPLPLTHLVQISCHFPIQAMESISGPSNAPMVDSGLVDEDPESAAASPSRQSFPSPPAASQVDGDQIKQLLDAFQTQLEVQQKQLDLLQRIATNSFETSRAIDETPAVDLAPTAPSVEIDANSTEKIRERARAWREEGSPVSPDIARPGKDFFQFCMTRKLWWFSESLTNRQRDEIFFPGQTFQENTARCQYIPEQWIEQLKQRWPTNLGRVDGKVHKWIFDWPSHGISLLHYHFNKKKWDLRCLNVDLV
jgi:hypothetical protein